MNTQPFAACSSAWTVPLNAPGLIPDGENTYEVRAVNGAGPDPTPAKGYIWIDDRAYTAIPTVAPHANTLVATDDDANDAGAHPDVSAQLDLQGYDDPQYVEVKFPDGLEGSLRAVPNGSRCSVAQANAGTCPASSKIGTITGTAESPTDGLITASGEIYLVGAEGGGLNSQFAAGVAAAFKNIPGTVTPNLGSIFAQGGLKLTEQARNLTTIIDNIPRVTTTGRPFHITSVTLNIAGDTGGAANPLITNPHFCNDAAEPFDARPDYFNFVGFGTGYDASNTGTITAPYVVDNCAAVPFNPDISLSLTNPAAGGSTGLDADVSFPTDNSTLRGLQVTLPPYAALNFPAFGVADDMCKDATDGSGAINNVSPAGTFPAYNEFTRNSSTCPDQAMVGTATINTPLLDQPVTGNVYLINVTPVPALGIDVNPDIPGNPQGVTLGLVGFNATIPATCSFGACTLVQSTFNSVPDVPVNSIHLHLGDVAGRVSVGPGNPILNPNILNIASANAASCKNSGQGATAVFTPWSGTGAATVVAPLNATGCNDPKLTISSPVVPTTGGKTVNTTAATINFAYSINGVAAFPTPNAETGTTTCVTKNLTSGVTTPSTSVSTNSVPLVNGVNDIQISCTDAKGTGTVNRRVDRNIPSVTINSPSNGASTPLSTASVTMGVTVAGTAVTSSIPAGTTCGVSNNGGALVPQSTTISTPTVITLVPGTNSLVASCTNASGTGTSTAVVVTYAAPNATWQTTNQTVPNGTTSFNVAYRINGVSTIPAGTTCTINGAANTTPASTAVSVAVGTNNYTVQCTNAVGSTSAVLTLTRTS